MVGKNAAMALITVAEAHKAVMQHAGDFGCEYVPLHRANGRVLRQDIIAERDQPPYDRVMMDGIAMRVGERFPLRCQGMQSAGEAPRILSEGAFCWEVTTGSVLPEGADCVVPVEQIRHDNGWVFFTGQQYPQKGAFIHPQASDRVAGERLLCSGRLLNGPSLAVLAANGVSQPCVSRLPSVAVVTTGNELVAVGGAVESWQVRQSNGYAIAGMLHQHGIRTVEQTALRDDYGATVDHIGRLLQHHDVILLSGGVSMGAFDHVPRALEASGVQTIFHKVLQRPGGPLWFGVGPERQRVFGLPGNPVSAMVCVARYVLPLLEKATGYTAYDVRDRLCLEASVPRLERRTRFVPVRRQGERAFPYPMPTSGDFMGLAQTDGLIELAAGEGEAPVGSSAPFYPWG